MSSKIEEKEDFGVNEKERRNSLKIISDIVEDFLEGRYDKIKLVFERPLELNENELRDFLGYYDSSNGGGGYDIYEYDAGIIEDKSTGRCFRIKKYLFLYYGVKDLDGTYTIHKIEGATDVYEESCKD